MRHLRRDELEAGSMTRPIKCRIFEWDMDLWCNLKATETEYLDYFGNRIAYPLCKSHYEYVRGL
jgi:hypothetical protein